MVPIHNYILILGLHDYSHNDHRDYFDQYCNHDHWWDLFIMVEKTSVFQSFFSPHFFTNTLKHTQHIEGSKRKRWHKYIIQTVFLKVTTTITHQKNSVIQLDNKHWTAILRGLTVVILWWFILWYLMVPYQHSRM